MDCHDGGARSPWERLLEQATGCLTKLQAAEIDELLTTCWVVWDRHDSWQHDALEVSIAYISQLMGELQGASAAAGRVREKIQHKW